MSFDAIHHYYKELEKLKHFGGTSNESSIRSAFQTLLCVYAKSKDLLLVAEVAIIGTKGKAVYPDGTLKDILRQDWGYWESKDEADDIDQEIAKKFAKGYPSDNILFEDSAHAILYQNGMETGRILMADEMALDHLLKAFIGFQRPEVAEFRKAIELFKADVPKVTEALRLLIETQAEQSPAYISSRDKFLELCKDVINPHITTADIREMVIQHILTADIFNTIFDESDYHRENNIAKELNNLVATFFTYDVKRKTLAGIKHYYDTINARAAQIADHHEKQKFLKVVYETFYKSYSPKKADRLGVVYTPNEIVRFMIESTDYLLNKHFGKQLEDKNVDILDPATGTGTFICDIIDHISKDKLPYKYKHELHANEVEILPYYIANLNIEFTYKQKTGQYAEFENLCFVDTLDNMGFDYKDKQNDIFSLSDENSARIKRQNEKKISVIIGNPPYNANQMNENENNKNREYPEIDKRIKDTYIKYSTAQKTKVYDMYSRFYRWAMDRIGEDGVICFITNNSYINARTFDGFRKVIKDEFQYAYVIDLGGNIRELSGKDGIFLNENNTIFGVAAAVGISIMWLVKDKDAEHKSCNINYIHPSDIRATRDEKLDYLMSHKFKDIPFEHIQPDKDNNWINLTDNDWEDMIAVADNDVKKGRAKDGIFKLFSNGIVTARDEWVYDDSVDKLEKKAKFFIDFYDTEKTRWHNSNKSVLVNDFVDRTIKWTEELESHIVRKSDLVYNVNKIRASLYRPFVKKYTYFDRIITHRVYQNDAIFPIDRSLKRNTCISISGCSASKPFTSLSVNNIVSFDVIEKTQCLPLYVYDKDGNRHDNITEWALQEYRQHYSDDTITREDIFHYVYGVLHHPAYRQKYEQNLKRSLPRIPYYADFGQWAEWGKALMALHIGFESVEPYPLLINGMPYVATSTDSTVEASPAIKPKLKADKINDMIYLDEVTTISGIPSRVWDYKLGHRSALEWILDQYKEKKPKDPTIAKLFNTYRFADYKDKVIDLLLRVTTVSVQTMEIIDQMERAGD